ncbi:hypothetical protein B0H16DRAFT_1471950 [Mycena metata]|uniref:Uncharacterized protein n=1 Tax=Mycena metata TaxID=1033252 RepID=A0AAD7HQ00_9AGAR|nr:hypothetical protein B0H16DRAFT_1471950 [Mycena metata]
MDVDTLTALAGHRYLGEYVPPSLFWECAPQFQPFTTTFVPARTRLSGAMGWVGFKQFNLISLPAGLYSRGWDPRAKAEGRRGEGRAGNGEAGVTGVGTTEGQQRAGGHYKGGNVVSSHELFYYLGTVAGILGVGCKEQAKSSTSNHQRKGGVDPENLGGVEGKEKNPRVKKSVDEEDSPLEKGVKKEHLVGGSNPRSHKFGNSES